MRRFNLIACVTASLAAAILCGMEEEVFPADANYDEAKVPAYTLPDPLVMESGEKITAPSQWPERRAELLRLFRDHVYGESPGRPEKMEFEKVAERPAGGDIPGVRREIAIKLENHGHTHTIPVVMYVPTIGPGPYPVFVGMHLFDTKAETPQLGQPLASHFEGDKKAKREPDEIERAMLDKLPGEKMLAVLLASGYVVATLDAETTAPDDAKRWMDGVVKLFLAEGQGQPGPKEWGAIGVWAWSLSRALDYFQTDPQIDAKRVIAVGHSRMGKTALWAGAQDERFAVVISNNSGCGGAALSKRVFGETVKHINDRFPHWFCDEFQKYNDTESALPVDQHELIALAAPRPVYVASAEEDEWADPLGEWLAVRAAEPVFALFGAKLTGHASDVLPELNQSFTGQIGYHIRIGKHALSDMDWVLYIDFTNHVLFGIPSVGKAAAKSLATDGLKFLREAIPIAESHLSARRNGRYLVLNIYGHTERVYADNVQLPVKGTYPSHFYTYLGLLCNHRFHLMEFRMHERPQYLLVDRRAETETRFNGIPVFSPNQSRFLINDPLSDGPVQIWRVDGQSIAQEWKLQTLNWSASQADWKDDWEITFKRTSFDSRGEPLIDETPHTIKYGKLGWECSLPVSESHDSTSNDDPDKFAIARSFEKVRRVGEMLELRLSNNRYRTYVDCNHNTDAYTQYRYLGSILNDDYFLIGIGGFECGGGVIFLDAKTGRETIVNDMPILSVDNKRFATINNDEDHYCAKTEIQMWRIEAGEAVKEFEKQYDEGFRVEEVVWASPTELRCVKVIPSGDNPVKTPLTLVLESGEWTYTEQE